MSKRLLAAGLLTACLPVAWFLLHAQRQESDRWNTVLTAPNPRFNTEPNEFLVRMTSGLKPGAALDVGMGQGRNSIYLARRGWDVTGFDPADKAVALARQLAEQAGVKIRTSVERSEDFHWGQDRWDLVVLSYVAVRGFIGNIRASLKPGGIVVLEGFHRQGAARTGGGVTWDSDELREAFRDFRIRHFEDPVAKADFGMMETRLVRLCAERPK